MKLSPHEIAWLVVRHWSDPRQQRIAVAVFLAESGGDTDALGRSTLGANEGQRDHGLTQVSGRWHGAKLQADPDWRDPHVCVRLARQVWEETKTAGKKPWSAWSVYNSGSYEQYLPDADHALAHPFPPPLPPATAEQVQDLVRANAQLVARLNAVEITVRELRSHFS